MLSSWDDKKTKSKYHYDSTIIDPQYDTVTKLGRILPCWQKELATLVEQAGAVTWRTFRRTGHTEETLAAEDYDLERAGYGKDHILTNMTWDIPPILQQISNLFALDNSKSRIHVQVPGQMWNLHMDRIEGWCPENPESIMRILVQLTDWEPGWFWGYGNYQYHMWSAGDVTTFDWLNVPHCTANAGLSPRVTLQITGIRTKQTEDFLRIFTSQPEFNLKSIVLSTLRDKSGS